MKYIDSEIAVNTILNRVLELRPDNETLAKDYCEAFVEHVLDYCHREDFPQPLVYTAAEMVVRWLDDRENGGRANLKSIKQDDTEFTFNVSDAAASVDFIGEDMASISQRLNLYRKVRW